MSKKVKVTILILGITFLFLIVVLGAWALLEGHQSDQSDAKRGELTMEDVEVEVLAGGLDHPWDMVKTSSGEFFFNQRGKGLFKVDEQGRVEEVYKPDDLYVAGEGGMLGLTMDNNFAETRQLYACFNSTKDAEPQVLVSRFKLNEALDQIEERTDIIQDIPSADSGRHSGCRLEVDSEGDLWVTTGDAAYGENPQAPKSLGGKVLRVDANGDPAPGNLGGEFDPRIFSYGHRNVQGLTLLPEKHEVFGFGFTAEHGPTVDDEINYLVAGNFGWDPNLYYDESVPMTDKDKFSEAIEAAWSSGDRTIAACSLEYVEGEEWGDWQGSLLMSALKDSYILRFEVSEDGKLENKGQVVNDYGRIRKVYQAPDGKIYFTTSNGNGTDLIAEIKLS